MAEYQRIVSYLYKYNNGQKGENTGFVRVETRKDGLRLFFHVKDMRMMDERKLKAYFYFHKDGKKKGIFVDEFLCSRGNCEYKRTIPERNIEGFRELKDMDGMVFYDSRGLVYGTCWDEREIGGEEIELPGMEKKPEVKDIQDTVRNEEEEKRKTQEKKIDFEKRAAHEKKMESEEKVKVENRLELKERTEPEHIGLEGNIGRKVQESKMGPERKLSEEFSGGMNETGDMAIETRKNEEKVQIGQNEEKENVERIDGIETHENPGIKSNRQSSGLQENWNQSKLEMEEVRPSSVERMLAEYPSVPIQWDSNLVEAVRIIPEDIAGFPMKDWKYAENGFLMQGYEIHHYLILGRIKMNPNRNLWVIGVPGIYNNREKYLAQIFGFYDYIPAEQGQLKTGGFGFWIAPLSFGNQ